MIEKWSLIVFMVFLAGGCSTQTLAVRMALPLVQGQYVAIQEETDPDLAERAIPANLKMMEGFLKEDPENTDLLNRLAEGFCGYAFSFLEDTDPARARRLYARGRDYASRSLGQMAGVQNITQQPLPGLREKLEQMKAEHLPALFWLAQCWGGWLMLSLDQPEALADVSKVEALMQRTLDLDETYHYAGPHLLLGIFYGSRTPLLGGNPDKARQHFEKNMELTEGKYLLTPLLYARTVAVQTQDRALFDRLLTRVKETPAAGLPEQRLANEVAKRKAKHLAEKADELF